MTKRFAILLIVFSALCKITFAQSGVSFVHSDSTSFIYYYAQQNVLPKITFLDWEKSTPIKKIKKQREDLTSTPAQFSLPENFRQRLAPEVYTLDFEGTEYFVNIPNDKTSIIYIQARKAPEKKDSVNMFTFFTGKTLSNFSISSFGIKAKYVNIEIPVKENFHIDIYKNKIHEVFPWQVIIPLIICLTLVLMAKFYQQDYIGRLFLIIFYRNAFNNAVSEKNINADKAGYILFLNSILCAALLLVAITYRYGYQLTNFFISYITFAVILFGYYQIKKIITKILCDFFSCKEIYLLYYKNTTYIFQAAGICLLVLNVLTFYVTSLEIHNFVFYLTVFLGVFAEFLKIFRLFSIIIEKRFPIFYLFLYLCTVEFLPAILFVKILSH